MWPTLGTYPVGTLATAAAAADDHIELPLIIDVIAAGVTIELPLNVEVRTPTSVELPLRVDVLDAAVFEGLDGAGIWAPAPDGRWQAVVHVGDQDISEQLVGAVTVSGERNAAKIAEFTYAPLPGVMEPMALIGARVAIAFAQRTLEGDVLNAQTIFRGVVDVPAVDIEAGEISITATDQLPEIMAAADKAWIDAEVGGRYRPEIDSEPEDNWEYCQSRLACVPADVALDVEQQPVVLPWRDLPRSATVRTADLLELPTVTLPSRDQLRTRIVCRLQYRYRILRGRGMSAAWAKPLRWFTGYAYPVVPEIAKKWLTRSMIEGATNMSDWELLSLTVTPVAAGEYPRGPNAEDGQYQILPEVASELALGFKAQYSARWAQTATEDYTVTVVAAGLEALIGKVEEEDGITLESEWDTESDWSSDSTIEPVLDIPPEGEITQIHVPDGVDAATRAAVLTAQLDRAFIRLASASRSGRVTVSLPCRPEIWLDTWLIVETDKVRSAGAIAEYSHALDAGSGEATTELSIAVGMPGGTAAVVMPDWDVSAVEFPELEPPVSAFSAVVGTYVGGLSTSPTYDEETMIGFVTNVDRGNSGDDEEEPEDGNNWYSRQLSIKSPDIDADDRDPLELTAEQTISVTLPTDLLELTT